MQVCGAVRVVDRVLGQLGRAVKAIDSKSIGVTRVSSSLTAVDVFKPVSRTDASRYGRLIVKVFCYVGYLICLFV